MDFIKNLKKIISLSIPRFLGFIDRDLSSRTCGCADRNFWHYKIKDYSNIRFQEVCYLLALLYSNDFNMNILFNKNWTKKLIKNVIKYSIKIQNSDGSFSEVYPFERSFCATSFYMYSLTETLFLIPEEIDENIFFSIKKAGQWLIKNSNLDTANQMLASILSLYNISFLLKDDKFKAVANERLNYILKCYQKKGYFIEYSGLDMGYNSISLGLIEKINEHNYLKKEIDCSEIKNTIFLEIDKNGTYNYNKFSRKTNFLYLYGIRKEINIKERVNKGLNENKIPNPLWMDDRYLIPFLTDYVLTYCEEKNKDVYDTI